MTEQLQLRCGNCAWYRRVEVPKEMQPPDWTPRGQCYAVPPTVYPIPVPKKSNLALAQGQQQGMEILPGMLRPIIEEDEGMCGSYAPDRMARKALEEIQRKRQAEGCDPKSCGQEGCGCEGKD